MAWKCAYELGQGVAGVDGLEGDLHTVECGDDATHLVHVSELNPNNGAWIGETYGACPLHVGPMSVPNAYCKVTRVEVL